MAIINVSLEIEIPDVDATSEQLNQFVWFYICGEGSINPSNPLYDAEYQITEYDVG